MFVGIVVVVVAAVAAADAVFFLLFSFVDFFAPIILKTLTNDKQHYSLHSVHTCNLFRLERKKKK